MKSLELYASKVFIEGYPKSRHANYKYILLESERIMESIEEKSLIPCFGIEVVREDIEDGEIYGVEKDRIEVMTTYRYKAVRFLRKLYDNCVSPVNFIEIAGPIADEWVGDFDEILSGTAVQ
jgi:hypothetical protein